MISAVIPTLNAEAHLPRALEALTADGVGEIVVADGGSTDGTADAARAAGARVIVSAPGRGVQLRAGAAAARGPWLLFLHADTVLAPGWAGMAAAFIQGAGDAERAAAFRFALDDGDFRARMVERAVRRRCRLFGLPYGDQGLLISRGFYDALGGYASIPLFEDVDLVRRIGRGRLDLLDAEAVTSAEAWRRDGYLRRSGRNVLLLMRYLAGADPAKLAGVYRKGG